MTSGLLRDVVTAQAGSTAAAVVFRPHGRIHVAVIVKATFAFAADAPMPLAEPQPIHRGEIPHGPGARSIRFSSDLVPYLSQADVLFTGHAHAPPSGPVRALRVRLALFDGEQAILDKALHVQAPFPFSRLPLIYEWAYGGPTVAENPVGTGAIAGSAPPNIVDLARAEQPAGFGPMSCEWPVRAALLKDTPPGAIKGEIPEIPEGFDWSYFQAAPPDQRVDHLHGDEWIVLEGLHPTLPRLRTRLPGARAHAAVHGLSAFGLEEGRSIDLVADTLHIDGDEQRCTLVWRGSFPVPSMEALAAMRVATEVGIESAAGASAPTMLLSDLSLPVAPIASTPPTMLLSDLSLPVAPVAETPPGAPAGAGGTMWLGDAPLPTVLLQEGAEGITPPRHTMTLGEDGSQPRAPALPFKPGEPAWSSGGVAVSTAKPPAPVASTGTVRLSESDQAEAALQPVTPFSGPPAQLTSRAAPAETASSRGDPGASPPPPPQPHFAPAPVEPPPAPPPAAAVKDPWAPAQSAPPMPARRPPPPPGPPRAPPTLKTSVYGTFKRGS